MKLARIGSDTGAASRALCFDRLPNAGNQRSISDPLLEDGNGPCQDITDCDPQKVFWKIEQPGLREKMIEDRVDLHMN